MFIGQTNIVTSDGNIKTGVATVRWIAVTNGANAGAFQLNDSTDDSGTDKFDIAMPANSTLFIDFKDKAIHFDNGVFVDVPGDTLTMTIGWD